MNEPIKDNPRDASTSMNGYMYQRYYAVLMFLVEGSDLTLSILEEGNEDVDIIQFNGSKKIIQVKYHEKKESESLDKKSGLMKVIANNKNIEENDKIESIRYISYNADYKTSLKKAFPEKKKNDYHNIGKYIVFIKTKEYITKHIEKKTNGTKQFKQLNGTCTVTYINDTDKLDELIKSNKTQIKKYNPYPSFHDHKNCICNDYFKKISLENGLSYDNLIKDIENKIMIQYAEYVNSTETEKEYTQMKITILRNKIFDILANNMFNRAKNNPDPLKFTMIKNHIDEMIAVQLDPKNLIEEYFKSLKKQLMDNNICTNEKNMIINNVQKNVKDEYKLVEFYLNILNGKNEKCDGIDRQKIINKIFLILIKKFDDRRTLEQQKKYFNVVSKFACCYNNDCNDLPRKNILKIIRGDKLDINSENRRNKDDNKKSFYKKTKSKVIKCRPSTKTIVYRMPKNKPKVNHQDIKCRPKTKTVISHEKY